MKYPAISIQILNYNGKKFIKECFDSLLLQNYKNFEIVLGDNASSDGSVDFIKKNYKKEIKMKKIRIIKFHKNYGVSGGYNRSYESTNADYVLLLNNDTKIPKNNFLEHMFRYSIAKNAEFVSANAYPMNISKLNERSLRNAKNTTLNLLGNPMDDIIKEDYSPVTSACCLLINKAKIKGPLFPEEYFCYGEDIFLGWKSFLEGKKITSDKWAAYLHYGAGTSKRGSYFIRYHSERNRLANLLIFFEKKTLLKIMPLFLLENLIKSFYFIFSPRLFSAFFNGVLWNLKNYKLIMKYRKEMQRKRKIDDKKLISFMSYKLFPEEISLFSKYINKLARLYCKIINLKTYDILF